MPPFDAVLESRSSWYELGTPSNSLVPSADTYGNRLTQSSSIRSSCISDRKRRTPPQTTMWPSPPARTLSISSTVSPPAIVVFAHSAAFNVREKTTLRPAFRIAEKGWLVELVMAAEIDL